VGISGVFNFRPAEHNGIGKDAFAMVTIQNGKWHLMK
jgi:branched-chain amino acid transport system substrate-binding protein